MAFARAPNLVTPRRATRLAASARLYSLKMRWWHEDISRESPVSVPRSWGDDAAGTEDFVGIVRDGDDEPLTYQVPQHFADGLNGDIGVGRVRQADVASNLGGGERDW